VCRLRCHRADWLRRVALVRIVTRTRWSRNGQTFNSFRFDESLHAHHLQRRKRRLGSPARQMWVATKHETYLLIRNRFRRQIRLAPSCLCGARESNKCQNDLQCQNPVHCAKRFCGEKSEAVCPSTIGALGGDLNVTPCYQNIQGCTSRMHALPRAHRTTTIGAYDEG
jgi:hypothetical protein